MGLSMRTAIGTECLKHWYDLWAKSYEAGGTGGAYVIFPYDIRKEFGRGRVKVHTAFDGEPYDGSIVNMGVRNADGSVCYIMNQRFMIAIRRSPNVQAHSSR